MAKKTYAPGTTLVIDTFTNALEWPIQLVLTLMTTDITGTRPGEISVSPMSVGAVSRFQQGAGILHVTVPAKHRLCLKDLVVLKWTHAPASSMLIRTE